METQVLTWAGVTTMLGIVLPPFLALVKRTAWDKRTKDLVILALLAAIGAVAGYLVGDINLATCSNAELTECVATVLAYVGSTVTQGLVWYKMFWEDSAVENKVAGS